MSKGGSTTNTTEIPEWLKSAAQENINRARDVSKIGYTPYYGPDVAAFTPMQEAGFRATGSAADAFGLGPAGTVPEGASFGPHSPTWATDSIQAPSTFANGIQGYSSAPLYQQSIDALKANRPGQYDAITGMFIDPFTGSTVAPPTTPVAPPVAPPVVPPTTPYVPPTTPYVPPVVPPTTPPPSLTPVVPPIDPIPPQLPIVDPLPPGLPSLLSLINPTATVEGFSDAEIDAANANIYTQATSGDLTGGDTFTGNDGLTYTVGYGDGEVDYGLANAAVAYDNVQGVNDAIYPQASFTDVTEGETFTGNDGLTYTVGTGDGMVDSGLATAVVNGQGFGTSPYDTGSVTSGYGDLGNISALDSLIAAEDLPALDTTGGYPGANADRYYNTLSMTANQPALDTTGGYPGANADRYYNTLSMTANQPAQVPYSSSGVADPMMTTGAALSNMGEAGLQGIFNNGLLGMGYNALTGNDLISATGSAGAPVLELSNANALPATGLLSAAADPLYNQAYWANALAEGNAAGNTNIQADLKAEQESLQDPNTLYNDAYSDVAINGSDFFNNLLGGQASNNNDTANKVENLYNSVLGRSSDSGGLKNYVDLINSGVITLADAKAAMTKSDEYVKKNPVVKKKGGGSDEIKYTGGGGTSSSAMGVGTAKAGFNFGL